MPIKPTPSPSDSPGPLAGAVALPAAPVSYEAAFAAAAPLTLSPRSSEELETNPQISPKPPDRKRCTALHLVDRITRFTSDAGPSHPFCRNDRLLKVCKKLRECSTSAWLCVDAASNAPHITVARCKHKLCPTCGPLRSRRAAARAATVVQDFRERRFLTFTLKHQSRPLPETEKKLRTCLAKMHRSKVFRRYITGGIGTIERTYNNNSDTWHVHAHEVVDGDWMDIDRIRARWHRLTGDSYIVDVKRCYSKDDAVQYITKYITKALPLENLTNERLCELAASIHGTRDVYTFGDKHGSWAKSKPVVEKRQYNRIVSLNALRSAARAGDNEASEIFRLSMAIHHKKHPVEAAPLVERAQTWAGKYYENLIMLALKHGRMYPGQKSINLERLE